MAGEGVAEVSAEKGGELRYGIWKGGRGIRRGGNGERWIGERQGGERGVVMNEGVDEGGDENGEKGGDDGGEGETEGVGGESFALVEAVCLPIQLIGCADLDEGGGGEVVIGEEVQAEEMIDGGGSGGGVDGEDEIASKAADGSVGVLDVEGGVGEGGRAEVMVKLVATGSSL